MTTLQTEKKGVQSFELGILLNIFKREFWIVDYKWEKLHHKLRKYLSCFFSHLTRVVLDASSLLHVPYWGFWILPQGMALKNTMQLLGYKDLSEWTDEALNIKNLN